MIKQTNAKLHNTHFERLHNFAEKHEGILILQNYSAYRQLIFITLKA